MAWSEKVFSLYDMIIWIPHQCWGNSNFLNEKCILWSGKYVWQDGLSGKPCILSGKTVLSSGMALHLDCWLLTLKATINARKQSNKL